MLDACTVGTTWELLSLLPDALGLSGKNDMWCKSNARHRKLYSPLVLNIVSRLVVDEVPGGSTRWRPGCFVFVNHENSQVEPRNRLNPSIYIPSSRLHLLSLFLPYYTHWQPPDRNITWLAQNNASRSKTHPIIYTTCTFPHFLSGLPSASCNCIIMLSFRCRFIFNAQWWHQRAAAK